MEREEPDTFLGDNIGGKWGEGRAGRQEPHTLAGERNIGGK